MSYSYLNSKVITVDASAIENGVKVDLSSSSYGLPSRMSFYGMNCFVRPTITANDASYLGIFDGTSSDVLIYFDFTGSTWDVQPSNLMLQNDSYIEFKNGLNFELHWDGSNTNPVSELVATVFYQ
jgi:hypothetical protein